MHIFKIKILVVQKSYWGSLTPEYSLSIPINTTLKNNFKIDIKQSKGKDNSCSATGYWQDQLVTEHSHANCPNLEAGVKLYIAGIYGDFVSGQIRNLKYTKK